jgi:hypothetical protein
MWSPLEFMAAETGLPSAEVGNQDDGVAALPGWPPATVVPVRLPATVVPVPEPVVPGVPALPGAVVGEALVGVFPPIELEVDVVARLVPVVVVGAVVVVVATVVVVVVGADCPAHPPPPGAKALALQPR